MEKLKLIKFSESRGMPKLYQIDWHREINLNNFKDAIDLQQSV